MLRRPNTSGQAVHSSIPQHCMCAESYGRLQVLSGFAIPPMPLAALLSDLLRASDAFTSTTWKPNSLRHMPRDVMSRQHHVHAMKQLILNKHSVHVLTSQWLHSCWFVTDCVLKCSLGDDVC